ncbi:hypothetical protein TNCV_2556621 [Trichonephila clavipes]|nr:hypothetical protein TNCV_2556621 [Trichonephila clavipes]
MKIYRDGRRTYRNCDNFSDIELIPVQTFDYPAIFAAIEKMGVLFSSTNLDVDNIEQTAKTGNWAHGVV